MLALKQNIQKYLKEEKISIGELERRSGLKQKTIQNILSNKSTNPSINTLLPLAKELGCSIEKLVSQELKPEVTKLTVTNLHWDEKLFLEIFSFITQKIKNKNLNINFASFMRAISSIYMYSRENEETSFDHRYATWWIDKFLDEQY